MSATWSYWKIYVPDKDFDLILTQLRDLVDAVVGLRSNWHFLRYNDHHGPHIRFRAFSSSNLADELHAARHELGRVIRADLYEPEIGKWGVAGVNAAERVFSKSSHLAVEAVCSGRSREAAQEVFTHTIGQLVPDLPSRLGVLRTHAAWWLGESGPGGERVDMGLANLRGEPNRIGPPAATRPSQLVGSFTGALADALATAGSGHPASYHLHQHLHMTMNRLGLGPAEEAQTALGELARVMAASEE